MPGNSRLLVSASEGEGRQTHGFRCAKVDISMGPPSGQCNRHCRYESEVRKGPTLKKVSVGVMSTKQVVKARRLDGMPKGDKVPRGPARNTWKIREQ